MNLHFSGHISATEVAYLDLKVFIEGGQICTSLYRKATAGNSILEAHSSHPNSLKNSIPDRELLRLKRNCTRNQDFEQAAEEAIERFKVRGYSAQLLQKTLARVAKIPNQCLLRDKKQHLADESNTFRFITTFSNESEALRQVLTSNWHILKTDLVIGSNLPDHPQITYRRCHSLKDKLVQSHFEAVPYNPRVSNLTGFFPCTKCKACKNSPKTLSYKIPGLTQPRIINKFLTCNTPFCICLVCPCNMQYIGSTVHPTKRRIVEHARAIEKNDPTYPVARHFAKFHQSNRNLLRFYCLDHVPAHERGGNRELKLRRLESRFIVDLQTKL